MFASSWLQAHSSAEVAQVPREVYVFGLFFGKPALGWGVADECPTAWAGSGIETVYDEAGEELWIEER